MSETELNPMQTYDAQQTAEEIEAGDRPATQVDVSADYEASKEFSISEVDRSGAGEKAAQAATAPDFAVSQPKETTPTKAEPTGDPSDYLDMAKEVGTSSAATGNVSDDLLKKAIEKGQAGQ
jgi:hypothetical protein